MTHRGLASRIRTTLPYAASAALLVLFGLVLAYAAAVVAANGWSQSLRILRWGFPGVTSSAQFPQRVVPTIPHPQELPQHLLTHFPQDVILPGHNGSRVNLEQFLRDTNTRAFIVVRGDQVIYERYFHGSNHASLQLSFSTVKSLMSTLVGIAIQEGKIRSVQDQVTEYLPELSGRGLDALTIRDLLTMSSGIPFQNADVFPLLAPFTDEAKLFYTQDARRRALGVHAGPEPVGKYFRYNDYHPLLEAVILERVTGRSVSAYLSEKLWKPLGMTAPASWNLDRPSGMEKTEDGLNARAIDFARFGLLFLHHGRWQGRQLVPRAWVDEAVTFDPSDQRPWRVSAYWPAQGGFYKYHWWGLHGTSGPDDYFALGHLGQVIYVSPAHHAVVVRFGGESRLEQAWPLAIRRLLSQVPVQR
ncbi:serine hydrolase domain-containing protein [Deinococcus hopiensis]|uniref:CubicO group peptidase, beta-lactamase class C family n=1 Tax=Deinococcus hopiensis KR-140 TaxID=695939 RepID=A0A1W1UPM3_9DEIO|nr:serine hydrolase [Deinococcus hopiensis]SMB83088.1 CubicO group peptidase, beta-lactamase class C family [Deinococcus hopiensis KR-140]